MQSLYDLSGKSALKDLAILTDNIKGLPKKILYDLIRLCVSEPKRKLAFQVIFQKWPFKVFAVQLIGVQLQEEDVILMASLIQQGQFGSIQHLDLLHKTFGILDKRATDAFMKVLTTPEPLLSTEIYTDVIRTSLSYSEAVQYAVKIAYQGDRYKESVKYEYKKPYNRERNRHLVVGDCETLYVYMEVVVDSNNFISVMRVLDSQNSLEDLHLSLKIIAVRLQFEYLPAAEIAQVLEVVNSDDVRGIDLSFNCLSSLNGERLSLVCNALKRFSNVENLCLAYNNIDPSHCAILADCLKPLTKLKSLDLSWNRLGKSLADFFTVGLRSPFVTDLILSGCVITKSVMNAISQCDNLHNVNKLKLDQNFFTSKRKEALIGMLLKFKSSLQYLDISSCDFCKPDLLSVCSVLTEFKSLTYLILFPNPGVTPEIIEFEFMPLLSCLPNLLSLPPLNGVR